MKTALLIVFNRPELTSNILEVLKRSDLNKLYIYGDGPRKGNLNDLNKIDEVWKVIETRSYPFEIIFRRNSKNSGCGKNVFEAITWFFDQEDEGIIIEDDLEFEPDTLTLMDYLLTGFKTCKEIGSVTCSNFVPREHLEPTEAPFYFSAYTRSWLWGTWKDRWQDFEFSNSNSWKPNLSLFKALQQGNLLSSIFWNRLYSSVEKRKLDTWDVQWHGFNQIHNYLTVVTKDNFVLHRGFGIAATHTNNEKLPDWNPSYIERDYTKFSLVEFDKMERRIDKLADAWMARNYFNETVISWTRALLAGIRVRLTPSKPKQIKLVKSKNVK